MKTAVTPGLRRLLAVLLPFLALLTANSIYLAGVTLLGFIRERSYENSLYLWMFLAHLVLGVVLTVPIALFIAAHMRNVRGHRNRKVVRAGLQLLVCIVGVVATGVVMTVRVFSEETVAERIVYWLHIALPVLALLFYLIHRLYGPSLRWRVGAAYGGLVVALTAVFGALHGTEERELIVPEGLSPLYEPSLAKTANGGRIPQEVLMADAYCERCHPDLVEDHYKSVHHFSSFNNIPYRFAVREARDELLARDGNINGARFCAACHDPVPMFAGLFDDPEFSAFHPAASAGITCVVCHSVVDIDGTRGNGNYVLAEPVHYPFGTTDDPFFAWINTQLIKAKPSFHKRTFLKPLHKSPEFCGTCHKVHLPEALNKYKWLRGQNHYDPFHLSGVSGHGARSFYYPPKAQKNCNECHLPPRASDDFAADDGFVHDHRVRAANTAIPFMEGIEDQVAYQKAFLESGLVDVDIFALREDGKVDGELHAPLRPSLPDLEGGRSYLLDVVIRTLKVGHVFTQGTADSNELWLDVTVRQGDRIIGRSGEIDEQGYVDEWSHFVNALVLDRDGNRIDRRNAVDIFVPLYSNQQPPGTGQVVHYRLDVPPDVKGSIDVDVALRYRKFDSSYMKYVYDEARARGEHEGPAPTLPIATMASDHLTLVVGDGEAPAQTATAKPEWQRWRDWGIGLFLQGNRGSNKGELRQASEAFEHVTELGRSEGWLDLARLYEKEGRLDEAREALERAVEIGVATPWTVNWLSGLIDRQNSNFDAAIEDFERVLATRVPERGFDFSLDYVIINELGKTELLRARASKGAERTAWVHRAAATFERVLELDAENLTAHYNLMLCYRLLGDRVKAARHRELHGRYKPDENAREHAVTKYRAEHPAADHAAESVVIYDLGRRL